MARQTAKAARRAAAPEEGDLGTCGWSRPDCGNDAVTTVQLDAGEEICDACGHAQTHRAEFRLCQEHADQYTESGDVTMLLLSAKEAE